jgi:hypothetical protein
VLQDGGGATQRRAHATILVPVLVTPPIHHPPSISACPRIEPPPACLCLCLPVSSRRVRPNCCRIRIHFLSMRTQMHCFHWMA